MLLLFFRIWIVCRGVSSMGIVVVVVVVVVVLLLSVCGSVPSSAVR
jgi:hypothetical protein